LTYREDSVILSPVGITEIEGTTVPYYSSSVSPKGQVTIPAEIRERFEIRPTDRVEFEVVDETSTIVPTRAKLRAAYGTIPPLNPELTWKEIEEIAHDEHAAHVASEGIYPADTTSM